MLIKISQMFFVYYKLMKKVWEEKIREESKIFL